MPLVLYIPHTVTVITVANALWETNSSPLKIDHWRFGDSYWKPSFVSSWWFQPIWEILVKWESSPRFGVKTKNVWNHHPVLYRRVFRLIWIRDSYIAAMDVVPSLRCLADFNLVIRSQKNRWWFCEAIVTFFLGDGVLFLSMLGML